MEKWSAEMFRMIDGVDVESMNVRTHSEELDIVNIFEDYAWLKDLLDHHDAREKAFLFPILDEKLPVVPKRELLKEISKRLGQLARSGV